MKDLSIIILSYNTADLLKDCIDSIYKTTSETSFEVIVVDNNSTDDSVEVIRKNFPKVKIVQSKSNVGFAKGNNMARNIVTGKYVLFLNSDTLVNNSSIASSLDYLKNRSKIGALTCKVLLTSGQLDPDTRRSFPTPWVALTHFSKLDRIFPKSRLFASYWYGYVDQSKVHSIEVLQGAFCMMPKRVLEKINWFDEDYFLDGEDIDLCWKVKQLGYDIVYYPMVSIVHIKGASKGKDKKIKKGFEIRKRAVLAGVESMEIFYKKRLWDRYPIVVNLLVIMGINLMKIFRLTKLLISQ